VRDEIPWVMLVRRVVLRCGGILSGIILGPRRCEPPVQPEYASRLTVDQEHTSVGKLDPILPARKYQLAVPILAREVLPVGQRRLSRRPYGAAGP
jgi:hypothetical protein